MALTSRLPGNLKSEGRELTCAQGNVDKVLPKPSFRREGTAEGIYYKMGPVNGHPLNVHRSSDPRADTRIRNNSMLRVLSPFEETVRERSR